MTRPIFDVLENFRKLFDRIVKAGGGEAPIGLLIDGLAAVEKDSDEQPDLRETDVVARTTFRKSKLYASFVGFRASQMITKAKHNADERLALLEATQRLPGLTDNAQELVAIATTLFNTRLPLAQRILFMAGSKAAVKVAIEWEPTSSSGSRRPGSPCQPT